MRGKIAILVIFTVAVAAAGFAWWWNYQRSARIRVFWGDYARTIRFAQRVETFDLLKPDEVYDLSAAPGLLHARTSLMVDESYDWNVPRERLPLPQTTWRSAVRFCDGSASVTLWFDADSDRLAVEESGEVITLAPKTASGWQTWLGRFRKKAS